MTPLVIDASALVEYLFRSPRGLELSLRIEGGSDLHIPALADVEVTSAIVRFLVRRLITIERAADALSDLSALRVIRHGHLSLLPRIITLRDNFSVYDATYIALAESLNAALVTADEKLVAAARVHTKLEVVAGKP